MSRYFIEVADIVDNDDGSAKISIDMSHDAMRAFAAVGIHKALMDMAAVVEKEPDLYGHIDTQGASDGRTGAVGSDYVPGKV
jgi:hypothetical protein